MCLRASDREARRLLPVFNAVSDGRDAHTGCKHCAGPTGVLWAQVPCNSLVLAEESHFFTAKFSNPDFGGSSRVVEFPDLDGDTLETVVTALLTSTIKLDGSNIERILHCADMLQVCNR